MVINFDKTAILLVAGGARSRQLRRRLTPEAQGKVRHALSSPSAGHVHIPAVANERCEIGRRFGSRGFVPASLIAGRKFGLKRPDNSAAWLILTGINNSALLDTLNTKTPWQLLDLANVEPDNSVRHPATLQYANA